MPEVKMRLKDGNLMIAGEVNERLPAVTNGLVAHFPFDGTEKGVANRNLIDYSTWAIGTSGSQTGFSQIGDGDSIIEDLDPFGKPVAVWRTLNNDIASDADGGWETGAYPIDNTKTYRVSVWVKRKVLGNGSFYLGIYGYSGGTNTILNNSDGVTNNTNPYFDARGWVLPVDEWFLVVGHIHPYNHTSTTNHPESGWYRVKGEKYIDINIGDYRWKSDSTAVTHRTYLYYSTDPLTDQRWCYPRIDLCDGTEPTIQDLLRGEGNIYNYPLMNRREPVQWTSGVNVEISDNTIRKTTTTAAWDAGARSVQTFNSGNAFVEWRVSCVDSTHSAEMVGLTADNTTASFEDIDFAIYTDANGSIYVYENGANKGAVSAWDKTTNNVFKVAVENGVVRYYQNNNLIYTSAVAPTYPLFADCSMHCYGARNSIVDAHIGVNNMCTLTDEGISVEHATINYVAGPADPDSGWGYRIHTTLRYEELPTGEGFEGVPKNCKGYKMDRTTNADTWSGNAYSYTCIRSHSCVAGSAYTTSAWCYVSEDFDGAWARVSTEGVGSGITYYDFSKKGTWQRLVNTFTASATGNSATYLYLCKEGVTDFSTLKGYVIFLAPQFEERAFATAFIDGSRGLGVLSLPPQIKSGLTQWTVRADAKFDNPGAKVNSLFDFRWSGHIPVLFCIYNGTLCVYYINGSNQNLGYYSSYSVPNTNQWNTYSLSYDGTTLRGYVNGELKLSHATSLGSSSGADALVCADKGSNPNSTNGTIRNFSIYNRALTDEEIKKISGNSFSLRQSGDIYSNIIEMPNRPAGAIYLPFGSDTKDITHTLVPVTNTNVSFADGCIWVGNGITNLLTTPTTAWGAWGGLTGSSTYFNAPNGTQGVHLVTLTSGGVEWYNTGGYRTVFPSTMYTLSAYVKYNTTPSANLFYIRQYRTDGTQITEGGNFNTSLLHDIGEGWKRAYGTFTTHAECTKLIIQGYEYNAGRDIWIYGTQLEQRAFYTPYVNGTRGHSSLVYNFTPYVGDWQEFSIVFWARYIGSNNYMISGTWGKYYFGLQPSGHMIFSWMDTGTQRAVGGAQIPFGEWVMIGCSVKNNTFIDMYLNGKRNVNWVSAFQLNDPASDFELNGIYPGHQSYPLNAYIRDMMIIPRAITPEEVANIYNTQMRSFKNGRLQIQGKLKEGVIL